MNNGRRYHNKNGGRCILVEIPMSDFDIQAVMLDGVRCMLLFY